MQMNKHLTQIRLKVVGKNAPKFDLRITWSPQQKPRDSACTSSRPTALTICISSSYAAALLISWWEPTANINETRT
jgi:hypothetical protein